MHTDLIQISWIVFLSISAQWLGWKLKIPAIVFFLIFGFLAGPIFNIVNPDHLFGDLLPALITISVGIILFEGSLTLNFKEIGDKSICHTSYRFNWCARCLGANCSICVLSSRFKLAGCYYLWCVVNSDRPNCNNSIIEKRQVKGLYGVNFEVGRYCQRPYWSHYCCFVL